MSEFGTSQPPISNLSDSVNSSISSISTSSTPYKTGNDSFDNDILQVMDYFEVEIDPPYADEKSPIYGALLKLPFYAPKARQREFCHLRVVARPTSDGKYTADFTFENIPSGMKSVWSEDFIKSSLLEESLSRCGKFTSETTNPTVVKFIDSLYITIEELLHPNKEILIRDFCYSLYDPRHWGRPLPGQIEKFSFSRRRAKVLADFKSTQDGQLSIIIGEPIFIIGQQGNGWAWIRKQSSEDLGLVPEQDVQQI